MMVKLNMLVCLSILGFTISLFEPCDCALDNEKFQKCVTQLNNAGLNANFGDDPPTTKDKRVYILKKMCESSLSEAVNQYIQRLNINRSKLYEMLLKLDEGSHTYNEEYNGSKDTLNELINNNIDGISNEELEEIGDFSLAARTFCNQANTIEGPYYISDLYTDAELESSSSSDDDDNNISSDYFNYASSIM